jgi:hypothetical protein
MSRARARRARMDASSRRRKCPRQPPTRTNHPHDRTETTAEDCDRPRNDAGMNYAASAHRRESPRQPPAGPVHRWNALVTTSNPSAHPRNDGTQTLEASPTPRGRTRTTRDVSGRRLNPTEQADETPRIRCDVTFAVEARSFPRSARSFPRSARTSPRRSGALPRADANFIFRFGRFHAVGFII